MAIQMTDVWVTIVAAFLGGGAISAIVGAISTRRKMSAEANALTSEEGRKLYDEMKARLKANEGKLNGDLFNLRQQLAIQETDIQRCNAKIIDQNALIEQLKQLITDLQAQLDLANDYVGYLLDGVNLLIEQLMDNGVKPGFIPTKKFRGGEVPFAQRDD